MKKSQKLKVKIENPVKPTILGYDSDEFLEKQYS